MKNCLVSITLLAAITANLLLPQQIVRYRACCYDVDGNLALHLCGCNPHHTETSIDTRRTCCDPTVIQFKSNSKARLVSSESPPKFDSFCEFQSEAPQAVLLALSEAQPRISVWDTGPPQPVDVLGFHSRLNL
jgi:hypothetical protein